MANLWINYFRHESWWWICNYSTLLWVSKLAIVLIWNIQSPHEDRQVNLSRIVLWKLQNHKIESSGHNACSAFHMDVRERSIYDNCRFDIGRSRASRLITKVSIPGVRYLHIAVPTITRSYATRNARVKNGRVCLSLVSKMALKKWNTHFRFEYSFRKNRATFSDVPLLQEIFRCNDPKSRVQFTFQPDFQNTFCKW